LSIYDRDGNPIATPPPDNTPTFGTLDVRRYNKVGDLGFNLRAVVGGALSGKALSPQYQHAPGGAGTLPGYALLEADCGARADTVVPLRVTVARPFYPRYGCDQYVLLQAEAVGYFGFSIGHKGPRSAWEAGGFNFELIPQWSVFFDASRAWASDDPSPFTVYDEPWRYDVGAGLLLGDLGVYAAYPLTGDDKVVRGIIRIGRRI
jgi:hemolysin activation/secretion protein